MSKSNPNKARHHFNGPVLDPKTVLAPSQRAGQMARPADRIDRKSHDQELPPPADDQVAEDQPAPPAGESPDARASALFGGEELSPADHAAAERLAYLFALERGRGLIPEYDPTSAADDFRRAAEVIRKQRALSRTMNQAG